MIGKYETYKIVYNPVVFNNGYRGVALIEAVSRAHAIDLFQEQYRGQFSTIDTCEKLLG
jgi:hypothetical protein